MIKLTQILSEMSILKYKRTTNAVEPIGKNRFEGINEYEFKTKNGKNKYHLELYVTEDGNLDISFYVRNLGYANMTNEREDLYDVMMTVMDIIKKTIKEYPSITKLSYAAVPSKNEQGDENKRDTTYRYFLKKTFPNIKFLPSSGGFIRTTQADLNNKEELNEMSILPYTKTDDDTETSKNPKFTGAFWREYEFKSKSGEDYVLQLRLGYKILDVSFYVKKESEFKLRGLDHDYMRLSMSSTNKGEQYDILATIMDIIRKTIKEFPSTEKIEYISNPDPDEETFIGNKRDKAYRYFLKKEFPNARFSVRQGDGAYPIISANLGIKKLNK